MHKFRPLQPPGLQPDLLHPGYRYREYMPSSNLSEYIACYWTLEFHPAAANYPHRIIPDGCVDIIIDRRSSSARKAAFVESLMTRYELITLSEPQSLFGIRFFPELIQPLLQYPVSALIGQRVFMEDIWGIEALIMVEEILTALTVEDMIGVVERTFLRLLSMDRKPSDPLLHAGMQYLYASQGNISIAALANKLSFSERHIRRTFDHELGLNPKEIAGIIKFQSLLQGLHNGAAFGTADIAMKYGYYDQSHFIKSFKRYYGLLPKQL